MGIAAISAALITSAAPATPPTGGFAPSPLSVGTFDSLDVKAEKTDKWDLTLRAKGETDVRVTRVSFPAHSSSGWHSHPGPNLLTVTSGTVIEYEGGNPLCTGTAYHAGETFGDNGGSAVHLVRNETGSAAEVMAVALYPHGVTPTTVSQPKPNNCPPDVL